MNSAAPFFSVIVPVYNAAAYIEEALESVIGQSFSDYEIVLIDDGSEDDTLRRIADWTQAHPDVPVRVTSQPHRGIGSARNTAVSQALGEYLAFLDADDYWDLRKLERVAEALAALKASDLLCHDEWVERPGQARRLLPHGPHATYRSLLLRGNTLSTSATVVRRRCVLDVGGFSSDLRLNGVEDYDLWLRLARAGCRIDYLREPLGVYRVHGQGISRRIEEHCDHYLNLLEEHARSWRPQGAYDRYLLRRRRADAFRAAGHAFMREGAPSQAQLFLRRAFREDPLSWKTPVLLGLNAARSVFS